MASTSNSPERNRHAIPPSISAKAHAVMTGEASSARRPEQMSMQPRTTVDRAIIGGGGDHSEYGSSRASSPGGSFMHTYIQEVELGSDDESLRPQQSRNIRQGSCSEQQGLFRQTELGPVEDVGEDGQADEKKQRNQDGRSKASKRKASRLPSVSARVSNLGRNIRRRLSFWNKDSGYSSVDDDTESQNANESVVGGRPDSEATTMPMSPGWERDDGGQLERFHTVVSAHQVFREEEVAQLPVAGEAAPMTRVDLLPMVDENNSVSHAQYSLLVSSRLFDATLDGAFDKARLDKTFRNADGNNTTPEVQWRVSRNLIETLDDDRRHVERAFKAAELKRKADPPSRRRWSLRRVFSRQGRASSEPELPILGSEKLSSSPVGMTSAQLEEASKQRRRTIM